MKRSVVIFGNGLGMALDPEFFLLKNAMKTVWEDPHGIDVNQKRLLSKCLLAQGAERIPKDENDLNILHIAVNACELLDNVANHEVGWLTEEGRRFPNASRQYLTKVAWYFHKHSLELPLSFTEPLFKHIKRTNTHIATLNYDNLLYQKMIEEKILCGYDGNLVDGFHADGFKEDHLERRYGKEFGYYLHLHGTPLYIEADGVVIKQSQATAEEIPTKHLVLAHAKHKPTLIDSSEVLSAYWRYLGLALQESKKIFVFGYAGTDKHLNHLIESQANGKKIHIIEWRGVGSKDDRKEFWRTTFGYEDIELIHEDCVLNFTKWD